MSTSPPASSAVPNWPSTKSSPLSKAGVVLLSSYEAEQHLLHFGRADEPMCWTICGLTSGYLSRASGQQIYVLEDCCIGKGDAARQDFARMHMTDLHGVHGLKKGRVA